MKILLLPGVNPATSEWLDALVDKLGLDKKAAVKHKYSFWAGNDAKPNLDHEVSLLPQQHFDLVISKSMGGLILLQALHQQKLKCNNAILFGVPVDLISETKFIPAALDKIKEKSILIVQQINDKLGKSSDLARNNPACLLKIAGEDHLYDDDTLYIADVKNWLKNNK